MKKSKTCTSTSKYTIIIIGIFHRLLNICFHHRSMVSKESKEKLSVNFLYEPPPGMKKEREKEDGEPEYKFEWQRKYNAPREDYCKGNEDIRDQPFGIAVRNVRCLKCHKWGHVNTDRECPLFNKARDEDEALTAPDPNKKLLKDMQDSGLAMTRGALNTLEQMQIPMQSSSSKGTEEVQDDDAAFLKTLTTEQKKKLLKKLEKMESKSSGEDKKKKKKKKKDKEKREKEREREREKEKDKERKRDRGKEKEKSRR